MHARRFRTFLAMLLLCAAAGCSRAVLTSGFENWSRPGPFGSSEVPRQFEPPVAEAQEFVEWDEPTAGAP